MIEPVRQGAELVEEIEGDDPALRGRWASGGWARAAS